MNKVIKKPSTKKPSKKKINEQLLHFTKMIDSKFEDGELNNIIEKFPMLQIIIDQQIKEAIEQEHDAAWAGSFSREAEPRINRLIDFLFGIHFTLTSEMKNKEYSDFIEETNAKSSPDYLVYIKLKNQFGKFDS